jgi:hypothetical protein
MFPFQVIPGFRHSKNVVLLTAHYEPKTAVVNVAYAWLAISLTRVYTVVSLVRAF